MEHKRKDRFWSKMDKPNDTLCFQWAINLAGASNDIVSIVWTPLSFWPNPLCQTELDCKITWRYNKIDISVLFGTNFHNSVIFGPTATNFRFCMDINNCQQLWGWGVFKPSELATASLACLYTSK